MKCVAPVPGGCDRKAWSVKGVAAGLCSGHRSRKYLGQPIDTPLLPSRRTPIERFLFYVDKRGPIPTHRPDLGPCHIWKGYINEFGHGTYKWKGKTRKTHQIALEIAHRLVGRLPKKYVTDHLCRVTACCNERHLEIVTNKVNLNRGQSAELTRERFASITHCSKGHLFDATNTYRDPNNNKRKCRICERARQAHSRGGWKGPARGARNAKSKLTEKDVVEIRKQRARGVSIAELAAAFGVHRDNISSVIHRRTWAWVP